MYSTFTLVARIPVCVCAGVDESVHFSFVRNVTCVVFETNMRTIEGPTSTCIHKKNRIQKQPMRIQSACFEPNQCSC